MSRMVRVICKMLVSAALMTGLFGCSKDDEVNPADVQGYNYTEDYIDQFRITGEEENFSSGGPNIFPKKAGQERSGGGKAMCCIGIPARWRPGMKLVIRWDADKVHDGKTPSLWYVAHTEVPPYGRTTYGFYVHFLPGDRIRVQIRDSPDEPTRPIEADPYVVKGVPDTELNKKRTTE